MKRTKGQRGWDGLLIFLSAALILPMGGALLLRPHKALSETENRPLQTLSASTLGELTDGSFFRAFSSVCSDQLPLRSHWIALKAQTERILGKRENNGILFGKEGYLIPRGEYASLETADGNLAAIAYFTQRANAPVTTLILPRHVDLLTDKLPDGYSDLRASRLARRIAEEKGILFPAEEWKNRADHLFRTDHHRTVFGAYASYVLLGESLGYLPREEEFFESVKLNGDFLGSSHSKNGGVAEVADELWLMRYEGDESFRIRNPETGELRRSFYDLSAMGRKDRYEVFLGGNTAELTVTADAEGEERPRLLLIKDSYANNLIPFLALHFDLTVLDLRYARSLSVSTEDFDRILILQGAETLATDPSLKKLSFLAP